MTNSYYDILNTVPEPDRAEVKGGARRRLNMTSGRPSDVARAEVAAYFANPAGYLAARQRDHDDDARVRELERGARWAAAGVPNPEVLS